MKRWLPGDEVVFRLVQDQHVTFAAPYRVIEDETERTVLYLPPWSVAYRQSRGRLAPIQWEASVLRFLKPGAWYSLLFFRPSDFGPGRWYVNLEEPYRRFDLGFESRDLILDVEIAVDGSSWNWKDEGDFEAAVERGEIAADFGRVVREQALSVVRDAAEGKGIFGEGWLGWAPENDRVAILPKLWYRIEGAPEALSEPRWEDFDDDEALDLAVEETRRVRRELWAQGR